MTTTQIANPHDIDTFDWLSALEAVVADSKHRDKPRQPDLYIAVLEAAYDLLIEQQRCQQPVVDAARRFVHSTPENDKSGLGSSLSNLKRKVNAYERRQS